MFTSFCHPTPTSQISLSLQHHGSPVLTRQCSLSWCYLKQNVCLYCLPLLGIVHWMAVLSSAHSLCHTRLAAMSFAVRWYHSLRCTALVHKGQLHDKWHQISEAALVGKAGCFQTNHFGKDEKNGMLSFFHDTFIC